MQTTFFHLEEGRPRRNTRSAKSEPHVCNWRANGSHETLHSHKGQRPAQQRPNIQAQGVYGASLPDAGRCPTSRPAKRSDEKRRPPCQPTSSHRPRQPPTDRELQGGLAFFQIGCGTAVTTNSLSNILLDHVLNHPSVLAWLVSQPTRGTIDRIHNSRALNKGVFATSLVVHTQHNEVTKPKGIMRQRESNKVCANIPSDLASGVVLYTVLPES